MQTESLIRLFFFVILLGGFAFLEYRQPRRPYATPRSRRWPANLGLAALNIGCIYLVFPAAAIGAAMFAQSRGIGLWPMMMMDGQSELGGIALWVGGILCILILDLSIYAQHVIFHKFDILWRLHAAHHADGDMDVTTGLRFHPLEALISMGFKMGVILLIGAPVAAVVIFEILLNGGALFSHSNLRLPAALDRVLRLVIVTPDMHRVHHSVHQREHNSNFGFFIAFWDRAFKTYTPQPKDGHDAMEIGLKNRQGAARYGLIALLMSPFKRPS